MNQRLIIIWSVLLVSILSCVTCRRLSLSELFLESGIRYRDMCMYREGYWLLGGERERERSEMRRDKDRNERFEPRNKNKQFQNPRRQWNSQLGSGLCFTQWRTFSGQPLSALLTRFLQHPHLIQPASILNLMEFRPLELTQPMFSGATMCRGKNPTLGVERLWSLFLSCVHEQASNLAFYKMGVVFPALNIFMAALGEMRK